MEDEVGACLKMLDYTYKALGFEDNFTLKLSTRPEQSLGSDSLWEAAEEALAASLDNSGRPWSVNPADGAFYGPKIDVVLSDAIGRQHQCGTIQLDFQQPARFELEYIDMNGETERPVIIHRAVLGSLERMMAILTEHHAGGH